MATYLAKYKASAKTLSEGVVNKFREIGNYDLKVLEHKEQLDGQCKEFMRITQAAKQNREGSSGKEEKASRIANIQETLKQLVQLQDAKLACAHEAYDLVDNVIKSLDADLKQLQQKKQDAPSRAELQALPSKRKRGRQPGPASGIGNKRGPKKGNPRQRQQMKVSFNIPQEPIEQLAAYPAVEDVDPNEPRYCICNRVSFGTMIACDNSDCPIEWYHWECLGIVDQPAGKWYCPSCKDMMTGT